MNRQRRKENPQNPQESSSESIELERSRKATLRYFRIIKFLVDKGYSYTFIIGNLEFFSDTTLTRWRPGVPKPTEEDLEKITPLDARSTYVDMRESQIEGEYQVFNYIVARLYKELKPETTNKKIKEDISTWMKTAIRRFELGETEE